MGSVIGVDIGQSRDPTAICVAETENRQIDRRTETHFLIRYLERLPLGTPYPEVVDRVGRLADTVAARTRGLAPVLQRSPELTLFRSPGLIHPSALEN